MSRVEIERIRRAYAEYQQSGRSDRLWRTTTPGARALVEERDRALLRVLGEAAALHTGRARILEVGCGRGQILSLVERAGGSRSEIIGIDLIPEAVVAATEACPSAHIVVGDGSALALRSDCCDVVLLFTVVSSILESEMANGLAREVNRVLRPGGSVVWYDFRYPNPFNRRVRGVSRRRIRELFPNYHSDLRAITVLPPLARRLGRFAHRLYPVLARVAPIRTHYLAVLSKPNGRS